MTTTERKGITRSTHSDELDFANAQIEALQREVERLTKENKKAKELLTEILKDLKNE